MIVYLLEVVSRDQFIVTDIAALDTTSCSLRDMDVHLIFLFS